MSTRVAFRILAVGLSTLACLVVVELVLQTGAALLTGRLIEPGKPGQAVVLAIGDSNVYGWGCSWEEAYPGQLQSRLDTTSPGKYQVLNLGLPGMNSTEVAQRLDGWLLVHKPSAVIVTVGVNNSWIRGLGGRLEAEPYVLPDFRLLRLLRLARMSLNRPSAIEPRSGRPELERIVSHDGRVVEQRDAETNRVLLRHQGNPLKRKPFSQTSALQILRRDLQQMQELTSRHGTRLVLLTYAGFRLSHQRSDLDDETSATNSELRQFARDHSILLVDARPRFLELLQPGVARSTYFLTETESHPNARGYGEVVSLILGEVPLPQ